MDVPTIHSSQQQGWQRLVPFVAVALIVGIYWPTFVGLSAEWTQWDESLAHAYPLLLWFLWLLHKLGPIGVSPQKTWVDIVIASGLMASSVLWFLFNTIQIKILEQLILLPLLYGALGFIFGMKTLWQMRFLLLMPLFAVPVWDYLNNGLVQLASSVVGEMVRLIRIPALIDGSSIFIPSGHIMIADGCSGLRYLIISLALGYTISYLNGYRELGLLVSLLLAGFLGLLANWIRIFLLILIGYHTEMESSLMEDHETFGWVLFAIICFPAIYFAPVVKKAAVIIGDTNRLVSAKKLLLLTVLLSPGLLLGNLFSIQTNGEPLNYIVEEKGIAGEAGAYPLTATTGAMPIPLNLPVARQSQRYTNGNAYVQIDQYIPSSAQERLVPYISRQYDNQIWLLEHSERQKLQQAHVRIERLRQKSADKRVIQVQWFNVGGITTATLAKAKLLQIPAVLSGEHYFVVFTLQAECSKPACENELQTLLQLSKSIQ